MCWAEVTGMNRQRYEYNSSMPEQFSTLLGQALGVWELLQATAIPSYVEVHTTLLWTP